MPVVKGLVHEVSARSLRAIIGVPWDGTAPEWAAAESQVPFGNYDPAWTDVQLRAKRDHAAIMLATSLAPKRDLAWARLLLEQYNEELARRKASTDMKTAASGPLPDAAPAAVQLHLLAGARP